MRLPVARTLTVIALLGAPTLGCSQTPEKAPAEKAPTEKAPTEKAPTEKSAAEKAAPEKAPGDSPMKTSPFHEARAHWQKGVAQAFERPADGIDVQPSDPDATNTSFDPHRTGPLMAWEARFDGKRIRGFAATEGPIVLLKRTDSLARLVDAAVAEKLAPPDIARRVVWMMGVGHQLVYEPEFAEMDPPPPEMPALKQADGKRTLTFMVEQAGDTGLQLTYDYTLTAEGEKAELKRARQ